MRRVLTVVIGSLLALAWFGVIGCSGESDMADEAKKMPTAKDTQNPDVPPVSGADASMRDDPKGMKGRGPG